VEVAVTTISQCSIQACTSTGTAKHSKAQHEHALRTSPGPEPWQQLLRRVM
jgi:hypothetical protein